MITTQTTRYLDCGCIDRKQGKNWSVFRLCVTHFLGRIPVQDDDAGR